MAKTLSNMMALGTKAPSFRLLDTVSNRFITLDEIKSPIATVIMFICNHCPYVKHIQNKLADIATHYQALGIRFVAISSNDIENYPADSPELMHEEALAHHYTFPYLYDDTQTVAQAYQAACTPDFYIFNAQLSCVYRGRFDGSTPGNHQPVTGADLCHALDNILAGQPVSEDQLPSMGCNIKWKT